MVTTEATQPAYRKHGVIVVHGQEDKIDRGEMISDVFTPMTEALRRASVEVTPTMTVEGRNARATLTVDWPAASPPRVDEFDIRDAFWNDAFPPPPAKQVVQWVSRGFWKQARAVIKGWLSRPHLDDEGVQVGDVVVAKSLAGKLAYMAMMLVLLAVWVPFALAVVLFGLVVYPLATAPILGSIGFERLNKFLRERANPFLSNVLGDTFRYAENELWADNARRRVEQPLCELLADPEIKDITIIAYSAGATVAFGALREGGPVHDALGHQQKPITFVTVGGALNRVFVFAETTRTTAGKRFLSQQMSPRLTAGSSFTWLDIHSRFDIVPGGPLSVEVKRSAPRGTKFEDRLVVNRDSLISDHFGYFTNRDLVVPRLAAAMYGRYASGSRDNAPIVAEQSRANRRVNRAAARLLSSVALTVTAVAAVIGSWRSAEVRERLTEFAFWVGDLLDAIAAIAPLSRLADWTGLAARAREHPNEFGAIALLVIAFAIARAAQWVLSRLLDHWAIDATRWDRAVYVLVLGASVVGPAAALWWIFFS